MAGIGSTSPHSNPMTSSHATGQDISSQSTRIRHTNTGQAATATAEANDARERAIEVLTTQLSNYIIGENTEALIRDRAEGLHEMEESPHDLAETMAWGETLDNISKAVKNAVEAIPFAVSGPIAGAIKLGADKLGADFSGTSVASEAASGAIDAATAMTLKAFFDKICADAGKDSLWLEADAEKLAPVMQEVLKKRQGLGENLKLAPLGGQGFNARNAVVGGVAVASQNNPQAISHTSNVLSLAAGAAGGVLTQRFSASHGPEYLLGRNDWKDQYKALKETSAKQQMAHGGARLKTLAGSLLTPRNYAKGALNIAKGDMIAEITTLAAFVAGSNALRNVVRNPGVSGAVSSAPSAGVDQLTGRIGAAKLTDRKEIAKDQGINVLNSAVAYTAQGVAGALARSDGDEAVDYVADKIVNSAVGQKTGEIKDKTSTLATQGYTTLADGAGSLAKGAGKVATQGYTTLADGAGSLAKGTGKVATQGYNSLASGAGSLAKGTGELATSAKNRASQAYRDLNLRRGNQMQSSGTSSAPTNQPILPLSAAPAAAPVTPAAAAQTTAPAAPPVSSQTAPPPRAQASSSQTVPTRGASPAEEIEMQPLEGKSKQA